MSLMVGDKPVELLEVGPAHTRGDILVVVPDDDVVFTGDILFIEGTPIMWEGPVENWIQACDRIISMNPRSIVPGHGPVTDSDGVRAVRDYLVFIRDEARARYDSGMSADETVQDIDLGPYRDWGDSERIVVNVDSLFREFGAPASGDSPIELFDRMAKLVR
jgi:glyoxylase-like metal-dependent hydrolase (beta-lactamase superfamily II)